MRLVFSSRGLSPVDKVDPGITTALLSMTTSIAATVSLGPASTWKMSSLPPPDIFTVWAFLAALAVTGEPAGAAVSSAKATELIAMATDASMINVRIAIIHHFLMR